MDLNNHKEAFEKVLEHLKKELSTIRTGRATPALVEDLKVDAYDSKMELKSLASISTPDARTITIDPWDKAVIQSIEKAIRDANTGLSPVVDGTTIRLSMPQLTEETRKDLIKLVQKRLEDSRASVRRAREDVKSEVVKAEQNKEINEDERFKLQDRLDEITREYNEKIKTMGEEKEKEIMTV
ncbi:MAG: ribosome recycling factor [Parcubacteria group bacterium]|nr:ribosome recycling factor [Parcubacteria group bacterium]